MSGLTLSVGVNGSKAHDLTQKVTYRDFQFQVHIVGANVNESLPIIDPTKGATPTQLQALPPKFRHCVLDPSVVNLACINAALKLTRGGDTTTNFQGSILPLSLASGYYDSTFNNGRWLTFEELTKPSPTQKHEVLINLPVTLPCPINLREEDRLNLFLDVTNNAFDLSLIDPALTVVKVKVLSAVGVAIGIPQIHVENIGYGHTLDDIPLNKGNKRVVFLNMDKTTCLETDSILKLVNQTSDKRQGDHLNHTDLVSLRQRQFQNFDDANDRAQSFILVDGEGEHDSLNLHLEYKTANVAQGKNYIVSHRVIPCIDTQRIGSFLKGRNKSRNKKKLKLI